MSWRTGRWFKNVPVGRNIMSQWTSSQAKKSGINTDKVKVTNHSLRATAVSKLAKQAVEEQQLIKITGHSNSKSLSSYIQMDEEHHEGIIEKMRTDENIASSSKTVVNTQPGSSSAPKTNTYYNCVFNYNSCNL